MEVSNTTKNASLVIIAASLWGTSGLMSKPMMDAGMSAIDVAALRMIVALTMAVLFLVTMRRDKFHIKLKDLYIFIIIGLSRVASTALLFFTQEQTNLLSLGTVLQMTSPCFVILISIILFRQNVPIMKHISAVLIVIGSMMVVGIFTNADSVNGLGLCSGILSGLTTAVFFLSSKAATDRGYAPETIMFYCFLTASIAVLPVMDYGTIISVTSQNTNFVYYIITLGVMITFLPYFLNFMGVKGLTPTVVAILSTMELVVTTIIGWFFFDQTLTAVGMLGIIIVIFAISISKLDLNKILKKKKNQSEST